MSARNVLRRATVVVALIVLAATADGAAAARRHRHIRHRPPADVVDPVPPVVPRETLPGLLGFDLGVFGAGISGATTALPPGYGFYGPGYHGPGYGQPGY